MKILSYLQKIGIALMVPVAILPAAAILMGAGYWIEPVDWDSSNLLAAFFIKSGLAIIENMPMLFAIGVSYGMSKDKDGFAVLTGFVGFLVVTTLCMPVSIAMIQQIPVDHVPSAFGKINTQFVGILVGIISAALYNRFSHVELIKALSFFNGRRMVPLLVSLVMIFVAFIMMYIWPTIFDTLIAIGKHIQQLGSVGAGIYAFFNRLLIPIGLHHLLNSIFWFDVAGINDIPKFLGGQKSIEAGTGIIGITGCYQAGFFPIMMFGLPGATLAIYHCTYPENRRKIAEIMIPTAFVSFFTGITEPVEFSFMFVAPVLYFLHAILTGLSVFISASMHWMAGFSFSAGLFDMVLSSRNPLAVNWYMLILQGLVFFILYYFVFRFSIQRFGFLTPGRELKIAVDDTEDSNLNIDAGVNNNDTKKLAHQYINAIGGSDNLIGIDACLTRLRLSVKNTSMVNDAMAKNLGAQAVIRLNKESLQIIIGTRAEIIANAMRTVLATGSVSSMQSLFLAPVHCIKTPSDLQKQVRISIVSPMTGEIVPLKKIPDYELSTSFVRNRVDIRSTDKLVLSPATGTLVQVFNTNYTFLLETYGGAKVAVQIGIDSVDLDGKGFIFLVEEGSQVTKGQAILALDLTCLNDNTCSILSQVIVTNMEDFVSLIPASTRSVLAGKSWLFDLTRK